MNDTKKPSDRTTQAAEPRVSPRHPEGDPRDWSDRRASAQALRAAQARQASGRRRLVDPATCERDYSVEEMEFMQAMQRYKQESGRMFPTWSEVLEVLRGLGYEKSAQPLVEAPSPRDATEPTRRVASA
jgi:hypothetical protein